jgi:hypothetical protein
LKKVVCSIDPLRFLSFCNHLFPSTRLDCFPDTFSSDASARSRQCDQNPILPNTIFLILLTFVTFSYNYVLNFLQICEIWFLPNFY